MGVCRGLGEHFDFSVFWIRFCLVIILFLSGVWPAIGIYFLASFIMKPKPVKPLESQGEKDFYESYIHTRKATIRMLAKRFGSLEKRIHRMENIVTAREFDWDEKLRG